MAKIFVHTTYGPEHPTRATLAFRVAKMAVDEGHEVKMFLAGDAVQLLRDSVLDNLSAMGIGSLREYYDGVVAGGGLIYLSMFSSAARGLTETDLDGKPAEMVDPVMLIRLSLEADRMFVY